MIKPEVKKRKKDLGIFYTPEEVVNFIFGILNIWKEKDDKKTGRWATRKHSPSIIDPAVGEGAFLKIACETNFTKPDWIFGLDIDENAVNKWKDINLLEEFGGKNKELEAHFFHQNGLEPIKWSQHIDKYKYKLKQVDIKKQQFDTVVGNPPYGGVGLEEITPELEKALFDFSIWKESVKKGEKEIADQLGLLKISINNRNKEKLKKFPIELLFIDRFIQLAKPGGWIAVVIPDGILENSNAHYIREFVANRTKVEAIISLPRDTFKNAGTNAKTSILFLRKFKEGKKLDLNYKVFLASLEKINNKNFQTLTDSYKKFYNDKKL